MSKNKTFVRDSHPELPLDPDVEQPGVYKWPPHFTPYLQLAVFVGGSFGAFARFGVTQVVGHPSDWPIATLTTNILGAFLLGMLLESLARKGKDMGIRRFVRLGFGTGFLGAFTTYSALALETDMLVRDGNAGLAITYLSVSLAGGIAASMIGIMLAAGNHKRKAKIHS